MNKDLFDAENVSCCMDGESSDYINNLSQNKKARDCWYRFHVIRTILRDSQAMPLSKDFNARVMQALEREPIIFAPQIRSRHTISFKSSFIRPVAGLAIAATVAAVTVLGFQSLYSSEQGQLMLSSLIKPVTTNQQQLLGQNNLVSTEAEMILAGDSIGTELDNYLLEHMEQSTSGSAQGVLPYMRLAGYDESQ